MEILEARGKAAGAVLVIHSWWGLTKSFRTYGASLARAGFRTGLVDLFEGRIARTEAEARTLRSAPRRVPMYKMLAADIEALRRPDRNTALPVGVVGFSMGGHWAIWLAQRPEYRIRAAILYYAARGGSFDQCQAEILAHFAERDEWLGKSARMTMERAIAGAGRSCESHTYPGTGHWFAEVDREADFDGPSAKRALQRDIAFLGRAFSRR